MPTARKIIRQTRSQPTMEGAGVLLKRAFQYEPDGLHDPFLLLDDFRSDFPEHYFKGFPWHPHRGIETITYVLHGRVAHSDSLGNDGVIGPGDVQWMTAGSGIIHQEMPHGDPHGRMYGFQLWANLPRANKMMPPRYREVKSDHIPQAITPQGVKIRVISGEIEGVRGPVQDIITQPTYLDVFIPENVEYHLNTPSGHTVLVYVFEGNGAFDSPQPVQDGSMLIFGDGDHVICQGGSGGLRFLLMAGQPIREPVAWYGPVVMNTQDELHLAFDELQKGTFIK